MTFQEAVKIIEDAYVSERTAANLSVDDPATWSTFSIKRIWVTTIATVAYVLSQFFSLFKTEVNDALYNLKPHSKQWYAGIAKMFQYGQALVDDGTRYDNTGLSEAEITARRIIKHSAVDDVDGGLRIKVATLTGSDLGPLTNAQMQAFSSYMKDNMVDAGVTLTLTTGPADKLQLKYRVYYNPLVLNASGGRIDGITATPVQDVINDYLKNLPFNGLLVLATLTDKIQAVEGVVYPSLISAAATYGTRPFAAFNEEYKPDAGYLRIYDNADLEIEFIAKQPIR
jgi:hypothetical protein